jgi:ankyrin repeat protein
MRNEIVMSPGMVITATTPAGTIVVTAVDDLTRSYSWEGATRSVEMWPREERWYGSLGLYYPGPGDHWKAHNGITRGVLEEGQQHFKTVEEALQWIHSRTWMPYVYRDDGLVVGWSKTLPRRQLNVEVWQILINGKKPHRLPGSQDSKIVVSHAPAEHSPLVGAVHRNDLAAVKALLASGSDPKVKDRVGSPVLVDAARHGNAVIVTALLKSGAEPNARSEEGATALLEAVDRGYTEVVRALLAGGADVNVAQERGIQKGATALISAAMAGHLDIMRALLEKGASAKAEDDEGKTALYWAAAEGQLPIAEMLLSHGAELDSRDWLGITPLMMAAFGGHTETVKLLIARGANVNAKGDEARRLFMAKGFAGDDAGQKEMISAGSLNVRHEDGRSVWDWAVMGGHAEITERLKKARARR